MLKKVLCLNTSCTDAYKNLATEYRLLKYCPSDTAIVFLWRNERTVVIGKNQNAFEEVNLGELALDKAKLVRRFTGGGAVYHDLKNLNFSFVTPKKYFDIKQNFAVILSALQPFGINAEISGRNDLTVDGKKFSGNAFLNEKENSLHHGTILIDTDVGKMQKYLNVNRDKLASKGVKSVSSRVVNLSSICPTLTAEAVAQGIINVCSSVFGAKSEIVDDDLFLEFEDGATENLLRSPYWIYGRAIPKDFYTISYRFAWGGVQIAFKKQDGELREVMIYSDCLDTSLCQKAIREIEGKTELQLKQVEAVGEIADILWLARQAFLK